MHGQPNIKKSYKNCLEIYCIEFVHFICQLLKVKFNTTVAQGQNKGRSSRAAARGTNLYGTLWCHSTSRKYGAGKLRFSHAKKKSLKIIGGLGTSL
jgi:hypothetical protein